VFASVRLIGAVGALVFKTRYGVIQQAPFFSTIYSNPEVDCPSTNLQRANDLAPYDKF
jgi:hypothetical protein